MRSFIALSLHISNSRTKPAGLDFYCFINSYLQLSIFKLVLSCWTGEMCFLLINCGRCLHFSVCSRCLRYAFNLILLQLRHATDNFLFDNDWNLCYAYDIGPHFLCWISGGVPFNTWLISSREETNCCHKLSKW